jgi:formate dehydrogenase subunit delta
MDADNLVRMANRIADFFAAMPDAREAQEGVANHIQKFWEPRMRRQLQELLAGEHAQALHPLVRAAMAPR